MSETESVFEWVKERIGEVFEAVDEQGISREEARGRIRKILEEFEAKLTEMIPVESPLIAETLKRLSQS